MGVAKLVYGNEVKFDLTGDTVTAETLAEGVTAHDANGEQIVGVMTATGTPTTAVLYTVQHLTEAQQRQARENIGINFGPGHAGMLLYVGANGMAEPLRLGAGLSIIDGALVVTGGGGTGGDDTTTASAICGTVLCGEVICGEV